LPAVVDESSNIEDPTGQLTVFISWSLPLSRHVAEILHHWLKRLLQNVRPWMSKQDIEKGKFWANEVVSGIEDSTVGIAVVTPANVDRPWINFEAGALARAIEPSNGIVSPLLINISNTNIQNSPLNTLQVTRFEKDDFYQLLQAINSRLRPRPVDAEILREEFEDKWPKLEQAVQAAIEEAIEDEVANAEPAARPVEEVLEDVVASMRLLSQDMNIMRIEASLQSPELQEARVKDARRQAIYEELSSILNRSNISVFTVGIHERSEGPIQLNIGLPDGLDENEIGLIRQEIESIPKFKVAWMDRAAGVPPTFFENATVPASKAWPRVISHG
jgi:hypothetical protein